MKYCELTRRCGGWETSIYGGVDRNQRAAVAETAWFSALQGCSLPPQVPCVPRTPHTAIHPRELLARVASRTPGGKPLNMFHSTASHQGDGIPCSGRRRQPRLLTLALPGRCWLPGTGPPKTAELWFCSLTVHMGNPPPLGKAEYAGTLGHSHNKPATPPAKSFHRRNTGWSSQSPSHQQDQTWCWKCPPLWE